MTFEEEMGGIAEELLTEFGFSLTINHASADTYDPATLTTTKGASSSTGLGVFFDPSNSNLTGYEKELASDVVKDRKWLIVRTSGVLATGDRIVAQGKTLLVHAVTAIGPKEAIVYRVNTEQVAP